MRSAISILTVLAIASGATLMMGAASGYPEPAQISVRSVNDAAQLAFHVGKNESHQVRLLKGRAHPVAVKAIRDEYPHSIEVRRNDPDVAKVETEVEQRGKIRQEGGRFVAEIDFRITTYYRTPDTDGSLSPSIAIDRHAAEFQKIDGVLVLTGLNDTSGMRQGKAGVRNRMDTIDLKSTGIKKASAERPLSALIQRARVDTTYGRGAAGCRASPKVDDQDFRREAMRYASVEWVDTLNPACPTSYTNSCVSSGSQILHSTCPL